MKYKYEQGRLQVIYNKYKKLISTNPTNYDAFIFYYSDSDDNYSDYSEYSEYSDSSDAY